MNTQNFTLMQLNAAERRQAILRQAQQEQLLAAPKPIAVPRAPLPGDGQWRRHLLTMLTGAIQKSLEKRTTVRSGSVS